MSTRCTLALTFLLAPSIAACSAAPASEPSPPPASEAPTVTEPSSSPEAVVAAQLAAYNAHDLEAFLATFHAEAELFSLGDPTPKAQGIDAVREVYGGLFDDSPELHSEIVHRAVLGNRVIDHERITGRGGGDGVLELVMIYEVQDERIRRAWSIRR